MNKQLGVTGQDWTDYEIELVVNLYLELYVRASKGEFFSKTQQYRALASKLKVRSEASVALKMSNISSVMIGLGWPYLPGLGPLPNIQKALVPHVTKALSGAHNLDEAAIVFVSKRPAFGPVDLVLSNKIPKILKAASGFAKRVPPGVRRNYIELEARNAALGLAGELAILEFEERRLRTRGLIRLANRIEHVSVTQGDGFGYDIHSFEVNGQDKLIEVKTTSGSSVMPFFVSKNELAVSQELAESYCLSRVFDYPQLASSRKKVQFYELTGALDQSCTLDAESYKAVPRAG